MSSRKTEDLNVSFSIMIIGINESKTLTKHVSCECKCKFDETKCKSNQWLNNNNVDMSIKNVFWIPLHVIVRMENP